MGEEQTSQTSEEEKTTEDSDSGNEPEADTPTE